MALLVPQPQVSQQGAAGASLSAAGAVNVACGPVTFADGTPLDAQHATSATYVLYRQSAAAPGPEAWDAAAKAWGTAAPAGARMFFENGRWNAILVAAGTNDAAGKPLFDPSVAATYSVACAFAGTDAAGAADSGTSGSSAPFAVTPPGADHRGGISIDPQDPKQATTVQLFLRDAALTPEATVTLTRSGGGYALTLSAGGATVELDESGEIALTPSASGTVRVAGRLEIVGSLSLNGVVTA